MSIRHIGIIASAAALLLSGSVAFAEEQVCTKEAKVCPDGTTVGRTGPNCEFARCPASGERMNSDRIIKDASTTARMEVKKEEGRARMAEMRAKAQQHLGDIKDKAKQEKAQHLATQFDDLNKTWTDNFTKMLDHYDATLVKVQSRAAIDAAAGKDVSATAPAVQKAKDAIAAARVAVALQAAKTYILDTSTLPTTATSTNSGQEKIMKALRTSFQTLHKSLFKDLFALRDGAMKDARKAVQDAVKTLGGGTEAGEGHATSTDKSNQ